MHLYSHLLNPELGKCMPGLKEIGLVILIGRTKEKLIRMNNSLLREQIKIREKNMRSLKQVIEEKNRKCFNSYRETAKEIISIYKETKDQGNKYLKYINVIAAKILFYCDLEKEYNDTYYKNRTLKDLEKINTEFYKEIFLKNYTKSYADPKYAVSIFGKELGRMFSAFYSWFRRYRSYALKHKIYEMEEWNRLFIDLYRMFKKGKPVKKSCLELMTAIIRKPVQDKVNIRIREWLVEKDPVFHSIVMKADLSDLRYLYQYCEYISDNEIRIARFLKEYPKEKIQKLAGALTDAYIRGFEIDRKDISKKEGVKIMYNIGQERIVRALVKKIEKKGLKVILNTVFSTKPNRQYEYDHRFDEALYFDKRYSEKALLLLKKACDTCKGMLKKFAGPFLFENFGENPFSPEQKKECLKFSEIQQKLINEHIVMMRKILDTCIPRKETSFSIVAFPVPEIGKKFEDIFEQTLKINMLDSKHYEAIQQNLVDVLDTADWVHVKGKGKNRTDITVKMQKLQDPSKHSNFENCGATVNIPVGEVFTTPQLKGTSGVLHVTKAYLKELKYIDLMITFKNGYITDYTCRNFKKKQDNRKYIQENLLFPHKTLPIGEFAIGTNTLAYVMAKKYKIVHILPVLIVEKMGPHFAIGDTCYSFQEDFKVYNPINKKEVTARDNEKSILRKKDIKKAYTNCHTDVTLPYEELKFITAITKQGKKYDIIRDGRFAVPGTAELNKHLEE